MSRRYSRITGTGSYLPERRVSNEELAAELAQRDIETSDEWIAGRTGIRARHIAAPDELSSDMAVHAARAAMQAAGCAAGDIDLLIVATSTPDMVFPSTATIVQRKLGIAGCPAFDVQAVCCGFIYAISVADAMLAEVPGILACDLHADGRYTDILCVPGHVNRGQVMGEPLLRMDGQAVFKLAVQVLDKAVRAVLDKAGLGDGDIDWLIPHQANLRIMQSTARRLHLPMEKVIITVHEHGNTSAASVPLALDTGIRNGQIKPGQRLLLEGVGGGFTWGAVLLNL